MNAGFAKPFFCWRVTKGSGSAFILGDVRALERELLPLPEGVLDALGKAEVLASISPPGGESESRREALSLMHFPEGERTLERLSPKTRKELEGYGERSGFSVGADCRLKPLFLVDAVVCHALGVLDGGPRLGVDGYLVEAARRAGKRVIALEGNEGTEVLAAMDENSQDHLLRACLRSLDEIVEDARAALAAWRSGDLSAMQKVASRHLKRFARVPELRLMEQVRVMKMAGTVDELLHSNAVSFVVTGALYLVGTEGLFERLRQDGANVEQMVVVGR